MVVLMTSLFVAYAFFFVDYEPASSLAELSDGFPMLPPYAGLKVEENNTKRKQDQSKQSGVRMAKATA